MMNGRRGALAMVLVGLGWAAVGCSGARAATSGDAPGGSDAGAPAPVQMLFHEMAKQVAAWSPPMHSVLQLVGSANTSTGTTLYLSSDLVEGGEFSDGGVTGGNVVGTMHGSCTIVGAGLSLEQGGSPGSIARCDQIMNIYDKGTVVLSGLIQQEAFEAGDAMTLAIVGGTGTFVGATGQVRVLQLVNPGVIKRLEVTLLLPM